MNAEATVFVIDDEEAVRISLSKLVRLLGYTSRPFASAQDFLASDALGQDGCLLLDLRMPGMSGVDLLEELTRRELACPAIIMSGHTDADSVQRLKAFDTIGFLEKPFAIDDLRGMLDRWRARAPDARASH